MNLQIADVQTESNPDPYSHHENVCLPWLWPLIAYKNMLKENPLDILGEEIAQDGLQFSANILKFSREAYKLDHELKPVWTTLNTIKLDTETMLLRNFSEGGSQNIPVIIDAPYAGHSATISDFSSDQSLVRTLRKNGLNRVYVTDWKSATDSMKSFSIDNYLQNLDKAVDTLGGKVHLIGICQGGWMSAAYAARFPGKVCTLTLAGAPIDTDAGDGAVKKLAHSLPMSLYEELVKAGNGRLLGNVMLASWKSMNPSDQYIKKYVELFEHIEDQDYLKRAEQFARWYESPLDLPGVYYLQAVEWLFKENRLAKGEFVALGKKISLKDITIPVYMLAGGDDDITPAEQVCDAAKYLGTPALDMVKNTVPGGHIGLFMGQKTLQETWPVICKWILLYDAKSKT